GILRKGAQKAMSARHVSGLPEVGVESIAARAQFEGLIESGQVNSPVGRWCLGDAKKGVIAACVSSRNACRRVGAKPVGQQKLATILANVLVQPTNRDGSRWFSDVM